MAKKTYDYTNQKDFVAEKKKRTIASWRKQDRKESHDNHVTVFNLILIVLLVISLIGVLKNGEILTFKGFLSFLQSCPSFELDLLAIPTIPVSNWGIFEVLGTIINGFVLMINALTFIFMAIINALTIILWFLKFVFL